jgi:outer membrane protein OmpA-like peptidoglycan-associated protein
MARRQVVGALCGVLGIADLALLNLVLVPRLFPERAAIAGAALKRTAKPMLVATPEPEPIAAPAPVVAEPAPRHLPPVRASGVRLVVRFGSSTSVVAPSEEAAIRALAHALRRLRRVWIRVEGHTDRRGESELNDRLSWLRAHAVAAILIEERIPAGWIEVRGFGAAQPRDAADEVSNRRVEIRATTTRGER